MALVTASQFDLVPDIGGAISGGFRLGQGIRTGLEKRAQQERQEQIRGLLGQAVQPPTEQQQMFAR